LLTQPYEAYGSSVKNDKKILVHDYQTGALQAILEAAKSTNGNISIVQANSADDAANKIENLPFYIDNLNWITWHSYCTHSCFFYDRG
jgi:hypothetical protein